MQKVKNYFKNYPESNQCFETSDGFIFEQKHRATAHGDTLKNREVKEWKRSDVENEAKLSKLAADEAKAKAKAKAEADEAKAKAKEEAEAKAKAKAEADEAKAKAKAEAAK